MKKLFFAVILVLISIHVIPSTPAIDFIEAAKWGNLEKITKLMGKNPELLNSTDGGIGAKALHWAAIYGRREVVKFLLTFKPDVNTQEQHGGTTMHWAAHYDDPKIIGWLLDHGAKIDHLNRYGRTPLLVAARRGCVQVIKTLIARGADINARLRDGRTALHIAAENGHREVIAQLVEMGLDPKIKNHKGQSHLDLLFKRPETIRINPKYLKSCTGIYRTETGRQLIIKYEDRRLYYYAFGKDELVPIASGKFITSAEVKYFTFISNDKKEITGLKYTIGSRETPATKIQ